MTVGTNRKKNQKKKLKQKQKKAALRASESDHEVKNAEGDIAQQQAGLSVSKGDQDKTGCSLEEHVNIANQSQEINQLDIEPIGTTSHIQLDTESDYEHSIVALEDLSTKNEDMYSTAVKEAKESMPSNQDENLPGLLEEESNDAAIVDERFNMSHPEKAIRCADLIPDDAVAEESKKDHDGATIVNSPADDIFHGVQVPLVVSKVQESASSGHPPSDGGKIELENEYLTKSTPISNTTVDSTDSTGDEKTSALLSSGTTGNELPSNDQVSKKKSLNMESGKLVDEQIGGDRSIDPHDVDIPETPHTNEDIKLQSSSITKKVSETETLKDRALDDLFPSQSSEENDFLWNQSLDEDQVQAAGTDGNLVSTVDVRQRSGSNPGASAHEIADSSHISTGNLSLVSHSNDDLADNKNQTSFLHHDTNKGNNSFDEDKGVISGHDNDEIFTNVVESIKMPWETTDEKSVTSNNGESDIGETRDNHSEPNKPVQKFSFLEEDDDLLDDDDSLLESEEEKGAIALVKGTPDEVSSTSANSQTRLNNNLSVVGQNSRSSSTKYQPMLPSDPQIRNGSNPSVNSAVAPALSTSQNNVYAIPQHGIVQPQVVSNLFAAGPTANTLAPSLPSTSQIGSPLIQPQTVQKLNEAKKRSDAYDFPMELLGNETKKVHAKPVSVPTPVMPYVQNSFRPIPTDKSTANVPPFDSMQRKSPRTRKSSVALPGNVNGLDLHNSMTIQNPFDQVISRERGFSNVSVGSALSSGAPSSAKINPYAPVINSGAIPPGTAAKSFIKNSSMPLPYEQPSFPPSNSNTINNSINSVSSNVSVSSTTTNYPSLVQTNGPIPRLRGNSSTGTYNPNNTELSAKYAPKKSIGYQASNSSMNPVVGTFGKTQARQGIAGVRAGLPNNQLYPQNPGTFSGTLPQANASMGYTHNQASIDTPVNNTPPISPKRQSGIANPILKSVNGSAAPSHMESVLPGKIISANDNSALSEKNTTGRSTNEANNQKHFYTTTKLDNEALVRRQFPILHWDKSNRVVSYMPVSEDIHGYSTHFIDITVTNHADVIPVLPYLKSFPGPLSRQKTKQKDVEKWIDVTLKHLQTIKPNADYSLWFLLKLKLSGNMTWKSVANVFVDVDSVNLSLSQMQPVNQETHPSGNVDAQTLLNIAGNLQLGHSESALQLALGVKDYTMALFIANLIGKQKWGQIAKEYLDYYYSDSGQNSSVHFLTTIVQVFAGCSKLVIDRYYNNEIEGIWASQHWKEIVGAILSNISVHTDTTQLQNETSTISNQSMLTLPTVVLEFLVEFGVYLFRRGLTTAASTLFVLANIPLSRVPVIKEIHVNFEYLCSANSIEGVLLTELYEYCFSSDPNFRGFSHLVNQKLYLAHVFHENGLSNLASKYSDYVSGMLKSSTRTADTLVLMNSIASLNTRMSGASTGWLGKPKLSSVWGHLDKSFNKYIGGDNEGDAKNAQEKTVFDGYTPSSSNNSSMVDLSQYNANTQYRSFSSTDQVNHFLAGSRSQSQLRMPNKVVMSPKSLPQKSATGSNLQLHAKTQPSLENSPQRSYLPKDRSGAGNAGAVDTEFEHNITQSKPPVIPTPIPPRNSATANLNRPPMLGQNALQYKSSPELMRPKGKTTYAPPPTHHKTMHTTTDVGSHKNDAESVDKEHNQRTMNSGQAIKVHGLKDQYTNHSATLGVISERDHSNDNLVPQIRDENSQAVSEKNYKDQSCMNDVPPIEESSIIHTDLSAVNHIPNGDESPGFTSDVGIDSAHDYIRLDQMVQQNHGDSADESAFSSDKDSVASQRSTPLKNEDLNNEEGNNSNSTLAQMNNPSNSGSISTQTHSPNAIVSSKRSYVPQSIESTTGRADVQATKQTGNYPTQSNTFKDEKTLAGSTNSWAVESAEQSLPRPSHFKIDDDTNQDTQGSTNDTADEFPKLNTNVGPVIQHFAKGPKQYSPVDIPYTTFNGLHKTYNGLKSERVPIIEKSQIKELPSVERFTSRMERFGPVKETEEITDDSFEPVIKLSAPPTQRAYTPVVPDQSLNAYEDEVEEESEDDDEELIAKSRRDAEKDKERKAIEEARRRQEEQNKKQKDNVKSDNHKGWLKWLKKESNEKKPIKAKLGNQNSFYYDEKLKRWVDKNASEEDKQKLAIASTPPPPVIKRKDAGPKTTPRGGLANHQATSVVLSQSGNQDAASIETPGFISSMNAMSPKQFPMAARPNNINSFIESPPMPKSPGMETVNLSGKQANGLDDLLSLAGGASTTTRRKKKPGRGYVNVMESK